MSQLAGVAASEVLLRFKQPDHQQPFLLQSSLGALNGLLSNRSRLADSAAAAERFQETAGLAIRLSATDLQRLCLLLHFKCSRAVARLMNEAGRRQLLQVAAADLEQLMALEGAGRIPPIYLCWRGTLQGDLSLPSQAVASYEGALEACETHRGEVLPAADPPMAVMLPAEWAEKRCTTHPHSWF